MDTDAKFGSLGSFFDQRFSGSKIIANPPFVLDLMNKMVHFITQTFNSSNEFTCIITVPNWLDAEYYLNLNASIYLKRAIHLARNTHYYVNSNNNDEKIVAKFNSTIFVLSKGFVDIDYVRLEKEIHEIYSINL